MGLDSLTIADGVLAIIIVVGVLFGLLKGFFNSVTKPLRIIGAICITICISAPIIDAWTGEIFYSKIYEYVYDTILANLPEDVTGASVVASLPLVLRLASSLFKVDVASYEGCATDAVVTGVAEGISKPVANFVAIVVTYLALFIVVNILLKLLLLIMGKIVTSGPLKTVDKILGVLFGFAVSSVIACIIANLIAFFTTEFVGGFVYEFFKSINPIDIIMSI